MQAILEQVRNFADHAHGNQQRKYTPEKYIVHPIRVMEICRDYDAQLPVLAAALLHDVLEDTAVDRTELSGFLHSVMENNEAEKTLALVEELTDVYVKEKYPQWNRRKRKEKELERLVQISAEAQTIKYADIIDNSKDVLCDPGFAPRYMQECLLILERAGKGNKSLRAMALDAVRDKLRAAKKGMHSKL
jgi:(p)ppGpp synthase/HD superfamily hydrolase